MNRVRATLVAGLATALVVLGSPVDANHIPGHDPSTCIQPDYWGPIVYDFQPGPSEDPSQPGTYIQLMVNDIPWYPGEPDAWANLINLVEVTIDDSDPIELRPIDGRRRVRNTYEVTLDPTQLTFGPYTLTFNTRDDCGRTDTHVEEIFVLAPGVVATCRLPVDRLC